MNKMENARGVSFDMVEPNAGALIKSLRNIGYTMSTAVADIVDNSLTTNAIKISIRVHPDPDNASIKSVDDGYGMKDHCSGQA